MHNSLHPTLIEMGNAGWVPASQPIAGLSPADNLCSRRALLLPDGYRDQMRRLGPLIDLAVRAVVERYFVDPRIAAIYALPPALEQILRQAASKPYQVGWYRPDLIFDRDGTARICEIGARYPFNGWMVSHAWSRGHADFWDDLCALFPRGSTAALVHGREPGGEVDYLSTHLRRAGVGFVAVSPQELVMHDGYVQAKGCRPDQFILQLDRTELLTLSPEVLAHLVERGNYFNDVRTLILVHDKRVLAVLSDAAIMRDAMPADLYAQLQPHLIFSTCARSAADAEELLRQEGDWIAKPSSGGRGIGTLVRSRCSADHWAEMIRRDWRHLMFQPYLQQLAFVDPDYAQPIHMVGMLLCRDSVCYGSGLFRGSDEAVINLHQDRGKLYPCMVAS
ncbi:hypothetical protein [Niveispirillum sp.]|uniref:hypothetical protein n=1 Tax=Niveispirillum sp. TaxID=1917217 RepID=UPI001B682471|nr:hypothetical protein [Niveispirillum sp.]MBP7339404.1 hypothetical protein [Niveispirillum sp.]